VCSSSAANGVTGLKPTWGRVSRHGIFDLAPSLDHIGPMCRSAADAAAVLGVIAGADDNDPTAAPDPVPNYLAGLDRPIRGLRIGIDPAYNRKGVDAATRRVMAEAVAAFQRQGADIRRIAVPEVDQIMREWAPHCAIEAAAAHAKTYPAQRHRYGPVFAAFLDFGHNQSALDYQRLLLNRQRFNGGLARLFREINVLLAPVQCWAALTLDARRAMMRDPEQRQWLSRFTGPFDYSGSPALTLPAGATEEGMPVGVQLIGRHFEEDLVLRAGHAFQRETDWHRRRPSL
jgi:amidase